MTIEGMVITISQEYVAKFSWHANTIYNQV